MKDYCLHHTHNDRGCGVAATELGMLAGADRWKVVCLETVKEPVMLTWSRWH